MNIYDGVRGGVRWLTQPELDKLAIERQAQATEREQEEAADVMRNPLGRAARKRMDDAFRKAFPNW